MGDQAEASAGPAVQDRRSRGMLKAAEIIGDNMPARRLDPDLATLIVDYAFGTVWVRPGLDLETRRLITLAMTLAGGHLEEFRLHVLYAADSGVGRETIKEVLLHAAIYCGIPASVTGFRIADEVYAEIDAKHERQAAEPVADKPQ